MDVKYLDDNTLIRASQGEGVSGISGWQALGELNSRNRERSSAPVQKPSN